ncbi:hypothetical protein MSAN_01187900 [Mycena sanguinolenta]|uniref:Uncharacterized protein n=1 Tax=Mycena sanguinolenta TaxID=230812 RepID=A0A8H7D7C7_9AGAR|nr:hypothetical protein MSAN_01187900 [Mycena sanguinolenta]
MRPLSLHTSALNDAEYTLFTENLASLLDSDADAHEPEAQTLTVREVRAWMRGRYPGVPTGAIDQILALFPSKDGINGGEFFAALRLVLHVEAGKDVDRALAFVQVHPGSATAPAPAAAPEDAVTPARTPQRHNPFLQPPGPPTPSLTRSKTLPSTSPTSPAAPVLPPRRVVAAVPPVPPPRHPPLPPRSFSPPKPSSSLHVTSTLMKQSLQASKTGQWLKQGQARLEQERVLQRELPSSKSPSHPPPRLPTPSSAPSTMPIGTSANASHRRCTPIAAADPRLHPCPRAPPLGPPPVHSAPQNETASHAKSHARRPSPAPSPRPPTPSHRRSTPPAAAASQTHGHTTRLTRSNSLRPSPPPPKAASTSSGSRIRPESVHALLGGLGARLANVGAGMESPFGDPVRLRSGKYTAKEKEQRELEREERRREREALVPHQDGSHSHSHHTHRGPGQLVHEDEEDSDSDEGPDYEEPPEEGIFGGDLGDDEDSEWVGVRRFPDSDAESASEQGVGVRAAPVRRDTITPRALERDSLKWPVDVEGEGWRPL